MIHRGGEMMLGRGCDSSELSPAFEAGGRLSGWILERWTAAEAL